MSVISADQIKVGYNNNIIIENLSLNLLEGKITTIIGPNGSCKSTLLKAMTRILPVSSGTILIDGKAISKLATKEVAKKVALLPQVLEATEGITVYELVSYGRFPHQSGMGTLSDEDRNVINWAMTVTHITEFANRQVDDLSGGQRQRVWIAMALAQDTDTIFLDEPTTYLDLNHQLEVLELLKELNETTHKTIVMVLHDLNQSARFSHHLIAMKNGEILYQGKPDEMIQKDKLRSIFSIDAQITQDPKHHCPVVLTYDLI